MIKQTIIMRFVAFSFFILISFSFAKKVPAKVYRRAGASQTQQVVRLNLTITIPGNTLPKKSFFEIAPNLFGRDFKVFAIQDINAVGNAQQVDRTVGATLLYSDFIPFEDDYRGAEPSPVVQVLWYKKRKLVKSTVLPLKVNEDVYYYLDDNQTKFFTFKLAYVFEME